jgi:phage-related baseplate assembly protein
MALLTLSSLFTRATKTQIYQTGLDVATSLSLPVTSWLAGDPTRSLYHYLAEILDVLEGNVVEYLKAGFLDYAEGDWLTVLAYEVYNVTRVEATYAETSVTLTNGGGGIYVIEAGDLTFSNTTTGKTYHNTSGGTLSAMGALDVDVTADEAGSDSSAAAAEIDALVTVLLGVTCSNATAAVGIDEEGDDSVKSRCRDKLGALSPNGPADAYDSVAKDSELTGTTAITRTRTIADSETGDVTVYLAGPSGAVSEENRALVETALLTYATPLTVTLTVLSATNVDIDITYEIWVYSSVGETEADIESAIEEALIAAFRERPIGGDVIDTETGRIYLSWIESKIRETFDEIFRVEVTVPAGDTDLAISEVAAVGTVTPTVNFVDDP